MFHWLKAMGGSIEEAYNHFKEYRGKASYTQLGLTPLDSTEEEESGDGGSSHMSNYDAMGLAPEHRGSCEEGRRTDESTPIGDTGQQEHREESRIRMIHICEEIDDTRECDCKSEEPVGADETSGQVKPEKEDGMLSCFYRGKQAKKAMKRGEYSDDDDSDDGEPEKVECNISGQTWEPLPSQ